MDEKQAGILELISKAMAAIVYPLVRHVAAGWFDPIAMQCFAAKFFKAHSIEVVVHTRFVISAWCDSRTL